MNKNTLYHSFYRRIGLPYELKNRWATRGISSISKIQKISNIKTLPATINVYLKNYLDISDRVYGDIICQFEIKLNKPIAQFRCLVLDCDILLWFEHNFISVKYFDTKIYNGIKYNLNNFLKYLKFSKAND